MILIIVASLATATWIEIGYGLCSLLGTGQIWALTTSYTQKLVLFSELKLLYNKIAN